MRFGQIRFENKLTAAVFEGGLARPIPGYSLVDLIRKAETEAVPIAALAVDMASYHGEPCPPAIPICPVEVWGCRSNVGPAPRAPNSPEQAPETAPRPDIFFKGTARVCAGPGQPIGIRFDSMLTAPEPDLAVVLGRKGKILGYTLANDISARDIERKGPLYLSQAKIYTGACALGPVFVTPDELPELGNLEMSCVIARAGQQRFAGSASLAPVETRIDALLEYLLRANPVPAGSVLLTGAGIAVSDEAALAPGDTVTVRVPEIGELANPAVLVR